MAVVRVRYEQFIDAYKFQKTLQKNYQRAQENLSGLRENADDIILDVWNEVEAYYADLPDSEKRENAECYGIVYIFRKNEIDKISALENNQY
jgi:antirestriction protein